MAYTNKDTIEKYMGVTINAGLDTFLESLISYVTRYIEQYCGDEVFGRRVFEAPSPDNDVTAKFDGNDRNRMYIGDWRSITSISIDGTALTVDDYILYPANYQLDGLPIQYVELAEPLASINTSRSLISRPVNIFSKGQLNIVITGKRGYSATPPADIVFAATKLAASTIKENISDPDVKEIKQESLGDYSVTFMDLEKVANVIKAADTLNQYKRQNVTPTIGNYGV